MVDGMFHGTGIRDKKLGGYVEPEDLGISEGIAHRIEKWLSEYEDAHLYEFKDERINDSLDKEGLDIARTLRSELPHDRVEYFSNAYMRRIPF